MAHFDNSPIQGALAINNALAQAGLVQAEPFVRLAERQREEQALEQLHNRRLELMKEERAGIEEGRINQALRGLQLAGAQAGMTDVPTDFTSGAGALGQHVKDQQLAAQKAAQAAAQAERDTANQKELFRLEDEISGLGVSDYSPPTGSPVGVRLDYARQALNRAKHDRAIAGQTEDMRKVLAEDFGVHLSRETPVDQVFTRLKDEMGRRTKIEEARAFELSEDERSLRDALNQRLSLIEQALASPEALEASIPPALKREALVNSLRNAAAGGMIDLRHKNAALDVVANLTDEQLQAPNPDFVPLLERALLPERKGNNSPQRAEARSGASLIDVLFRAEAARLIQEQERAHSKELLDISSEWRQFLDNRRKADTPKVSNPSEGKAATWKNSAFPFGS